MYIYIYIHLSSANSSEPMAPRHLGGVWRKIASIPGPADPWWMLMGFFRGETTNLGFPEMGVPPYHPFLDGIFHSTPSILWGTPFWETSKYK